MHDKSARVQYSNVVVVRSTNSSLLNVTLMPNPVHTRASLKIETGRSVTATIRIINSLGMVMSVENVNLNKGENLVSLSDIRLLYTGVYQVVVNAAGNSSHVKMLLNR